MRRSKAAKADAIDAELIRVGAGASSVPKRSDRGPAVLVVVAGSGSALSGDAWVAVGPGDRIPADPGEPVALRSAGEAIIAVFLRSPSAGAKAA